RLDYVRLLKPLENLAALAYVFLAVENHVGKLVDQFAAQEFQDGQPEQDVNFDVLLMLRPVQRALQNLRQQLAKRGGIHLFVASKIDSREIGRTDILPDQVK